MNTRTLTYRTDNYPPQNDKYGDDAINTKHENTSAYNEIVPTSNDVLLGRGAFINEHSGNRRFRNLALEHKLLFDAACLADKRQLSLDIVSLIKGIALTSLPSDIIFPAFSNATFLLYSQIIIQLLILVEDF